MTWWKIKSRLSIWLFRLSVWIIGEYTLSFHFRLPPTQIGWSFMSVSMGRDGVTVMLDDARLLDFHPATHTHLFPDVPDGSVLAQMTLVEGKIETKLDFTEEDDEAT